MQNTFSINSFVVVRSFLPIDVSSISSDVVSKPLLIKTAILSAVSESVGMQGARPHFVGVVTRCWFFAVFTIEGCAFGDLNMISDDLGTAPWGFAVTSATP